MTFQKTIRKNTNYYYKMSSLYYVCIYKSKEIVSTKTSFNNLPPDIVRKILIDYLTIRDVTSFLCTNKYYGKMFNEVCWSMLAKKWYPKVNKNKFLTYKDLILLTSRGEHKVLQNQNTKATDPLGIISVIYYNTQYDNKSSVLSPDDEFDCGWENTRTKKIIFLVLTTELQIKTCIFENNITFCECKLDKVLEPSKNKYTEEEWNFDVKHEECLSGYCEHEGEPHSYCSEEDQQFMKKRKEKEKANITAFLRRKTSPTSYKIENIKHNIPNNKKIIKIIKIDKDCLNLCNDKKYHHDTEFEDEDVFNEKNNMVLVQTNDNEIYYGYLKISQIEFEKVLFPITDKTCFFAYNSNVNLLHSTPKYYAVSLQTKKSLIIHNISKKTSYNIRVTPPIEGLYFIRYRNNRIFLIECIDKNTIMFGSCKIKDESMRLYLVDHPLDIIKDVFISKGNCSLFLVGTLNGIKRVYGVTWDGRNKLFKEEDTKIVAQSPDGTMNLISEKFTNDWYERYKTNIISVPMVQHNAYGDGTTLKMYNSYSDEEKFYFLTKDEQLL